MIYSFRFLVLLCFLSLIQGDLIALSDLTQTREGFEGIIKFQIKSSMEDLNKAMMPAFTEYHIKGDDIVIQMFGADNAKLARILIKGDQSTFYLVDDEENNFVSEKIDLKETGETLSIQGYRCTKYVVTAKAGEALVESEVWLTDKILVTIPEVLKDKNNPLLLFMNEKGFPLRFIGKSISNGQNYNFEMVAVKVAQGHLDPGDFEIPEDYHISDMTSFLEK
jgi:hypothetical protein